MSDTGIRLAPLLTEIRLDTSGFNQDINEASAIGINGAQNISDRMGVTLKIGSALSGMGDKLTKGLSLPLIGVGIATGKMAVDFESSFAQVSTLLDKNTVDYESYKDEIIQASNDSKIAVDEFSESVYGSISAGVDQTKAIEFTTEAMKLAKGGFTDGASAVDILTTAINGYGMETEDATRISDMLITTQNLGKTTVNELASSMGAVIPVAGSVNFSIEELSASYAQLTKNGIATSEAGTYVKAMLSELGKSGSITDKTLKELTGKSFAKLKEEGVSTTDILKTLSDAAEQNGMTLKDMFGSVEAGSAALVLAKGGGQEYNEMLSAMGNSASATQDAFEKMDSTPAEKMKGALNELRNAGIRFGESFVPVIETVADKISGLAEWFSNLSQEQQENAIKWGAVLVAAGPVLKLVGGGITTFANLSTVISGANAAIGTAGAGGLVGGFGALSSVVLPIAGIVAGVGVAIYGVHEKTDLMNSTILKSREEMSWMQKILADLGGTTTYTKDELVNLGYVHQEFSDTISPAFQKAVEDSTKDLQELNIFLKETNFDGVLSPEESDEFNSRVDRMCQEAIDTINNKKEEASKGLSDLFTVDDGVLDQSEQTVLNYLNRNYENNITKIQEIKDEVYRIKQKAIEEGRGLNNQEIEDVETKLAKIKELELESVGGTQEEIMYAKNEFMARVSQMELADQSALLQEKAKARDEEVVNIKAAYDTQIQTIEQGMASANEVEYRELEKQRNKLVEDKEAKIQTQEDLYEQYVGIVREGNKNTMDEINKYNGKMLTQADHASQDQLGSMQKHYDGLENITKTGCYTMYNQMSKSYADVAVIVDEKTGDIIAAYDKTTGMTGAYTAQMSNDAKDMAEKQGAAFEAIVGSHAAYDASSGSVVLAGGEISLALKDVEEKADGTKQGIIDLNGTPVKVQINKDNTITALNEIENKVNKLDGRQVSIGVNIFEKAREKDFGWIKNGNHYNGLNNVPFDGYRAVLHKNERVLTAEENKKYSEGKNTQNYPESITAVVNVDGKELARASMPFIDKALEKKMAKERRG